MWNIRIFLVSLFLLPSVLFSAGTDMENQPFSKIRGAFVNSGRKTSPKAVTLVYETSGLDKSAPIIVVRAKQPDKVRIDMISDKETITACRNGGEFWGREASGTVRSLTDEESEKFARDIAFLPIQAHTEEIYGNLEKTGQETLGKTPCTVYRTSPLKGSPEKLRIWLEDYTGLLHRSDVSCDEGTAVTVYRHYRDFGGIKLATSILHSDIDVCFTMKLRSAEWDPELTDAEVFSKTAPVRPADLLQLPHRQKKTDSESFPQTQKQAKIAKLEKTIRKLEIEISADAAALEKMEQTFDKNKNAALGLATAPTSAPAPVTVPVVTWGRRGRGLYFVTRYQSGTRQYAIRRKMFNSLQKESGTLAKKYDTMSKKLVEKRIRLSDAQAELKQLQED